VGVQRPFDMGPFDELGFNYRLSDVQAAMGVAQMARLDDLIRERRARAARYTALLEGVEWITLPNEPRGYFHTYQSYVVRIADDSPMSRNAIMLELEQTGIQSRPGTLAVHTTGYYRNRYKLRPEDCPMSWRAQEQTMTLPLFPGMTDEQQDQVANALKSFGARPRLDGR
jgi:dTDP-4-amino-4,6-dideoxygalactose transaminase